MDTTTINTLITAASGAVVGLVGMYIHGNQLGKRIDDLRTDTNRAFDVLRADSNRQFDKIDGRFEKVDAKLERIESDVRQWNDIQRDQSERITNLENRKP